jgi:hypothetical protein
MYSVVFRGHGYGNRMKRDRYRLRLNYSASPAYFLRTLYNQNSSPDAITATKLRTIDVVKACKKDVRDEKGIGNILIGKPERKRQLGRPRCR